jgi:class 3 adenylate cyclase
VLGFSDAGRIPVARTHRYHWDLDLRSPPDALWPRIADTNRFNRDTRVPRVERGSGVEAGVMAAEGASPLARPMSLKALGLRIRWLEEPFEWVEPRRFSVVRRCIGGPVKSLRVEMVLEPRGGGSRLSYTVEAVARNRVGSAFIRGQIGLFTWPAIVRVFRRYDREASAAGVLRLGDTISGALPDADGGDSPTHDRRLRALWQDLIARGQDRACVDRLVHLVETGDDLALSRMKPYLIADRWGADRRAVLTLMLHATRAGLLNLRWDLLCPLCRGSKSNAGALRDLPAGVHCDACHIDVTARLDRFVELTFRPNGAIRAIEASEYCIGGPGSTPHIVAQQALGAGESRGVSVRLAPGRYRLRTKTGVDPERDRSARLISVAAAHSSDALVFQAEEEAEGEAILGLDAAIELINARDRPRLFMLERLAWADDAVTAAEVFAMQPFRDLFSAEALRPGEQVSVGSVTLLFTDVKDSTRLYREIGDAPAFGRVMSHFEVLREVVARHEGAVVKTMGDAIMAVFTRPSRGASAALEMQRALRESNGRAGLGAVRLKAALHAGPCIAVTLNDRLDYFGSTVNIAARLVGLAQGGEVVMSEAVWNDPDVAAAHRGTGEDPIECTLRGFDDQRFRAWRLRV